MPFPSRSSSSRTINGCSVSSGRFSRVTPACRDCRQITRCTWIAHAGAQSTDRKVRSVDVNSIAHDRLPWNVISRRPPDRAQGRSLRHRQVDDPDKDIHWFVLVIKDRVFLWES
jgi:hypothetical protein